MRRLLALVQRCLLALLQPARALPAAAALQPAKPVALPATPELSDADRVIGLMQLRAAFHKYSPPAPPAQA